MKVLGLVASARRLGNSEILAKEIMSRLPEGMDKVMIRLTDLHIQQCTACYACLPEDKSCVIQDDFGFVINQIKQADAVVIAAPCYFLGPHTAVKLMNDRLISVINDARAFAGKKCVVAVSYGIDEWQGYALEATVSFARFLHLDVVGSMLVRAASPGEAVRPEVLTETQRLAEALVGGPKTEPETGIQHCEACGSSLLQLTSAGRVECRLCGSKGFIEKEDGGRFRIRFETSQHPRYSPEGMTEHGRVLEAVRDQYLAERQQLNKLRKPYQAIDWWIKP